MRCCDRAIVPQSWRLGPAASTVYHIAAERKEKAVVVDMIGRTVGPYEIVEQVGASDTATVYKAYRPALNLYVAVKVLQAQPNVNEDAVWRFEREARTTARLTHPNIIHVHRIGQEGDLYYVAMDYVDGPSLAQRLRDGGALDPAAALAVLRQVGAALASPMPKGWCTAASSLQTSCSPPTGGPLSLTLG